MSVWGNTLVRTFHLEELPQAEKNKQRLAVELAIWIVLAGAFYKLVYIFLGYSSVIASSVTSIIVTLINLIIFKITRNFKWFGNSQLLIILTFGLLTHAFLGGFVDSSGLALCAVLPAIGALMFSSVQTARLLFVCFCLGLVGLAIWESQRLEIPYTLPRSLSLTFFVVNFICITAIIYFIIESFYSKMNAFQLSLEVEKEKSESLLMNILPNSIIEELKHTGQSKAKLFNHVSVLFTDFVNFTHISEQLSPEELVAEIDYCFKGFDAIVEQNRLEKIKTIGDAYLAVCGLPNEDDDHAVKTIRAAIEMLKFIRQRKADGGKFDVRIGVHSGPLVAGIVGVKKFAYDIWGDTVNTASRMESSGEAGKINISRETYELVKHDFHCVYRGKIDAKNKGEVDMYFIEVG
ncbi:MAG TPA: adenylate/guanylate cyclase domain-containing protein [Chitinophagaceae bacterium]|nr:adenylate/guanylate cyclase domain-containing protein [Chitinophagaceae bacterium]